MRETLFQAIEAHWFAETLTTVGLLAFGWLRAKKPAIATVVLYGFVGAASILIIYQVLTEPSETTPENVESKIKVWAENFGQGTQVVKESEDPTAFFNIGVTLRSGRGITIRRTKELPRYLSLATNINLDPASHKFLMGFRTNRGTYFSLSIF
jgi:hypothetical protein